MTYFLVNAKIQMDAAALLFQIVFLNLTIFLEGKKYNPANTFEDNDDSGKKWNIENDDNKLGWTSKSFSKSILPELNEVEWKGDSPNNDLWSNISSYFWKIFGHQHQEKYSNLTAYLPHHVRIKRENQRRYIVKCCGAQSCTDGTMGSYVRRQEDKVQKEKEDSFVNELQYKRRRKKKKNPQANLAQFHAYGVFTDSGIHISCSGCPLGWPEMLTVYPDYEFGIPVTCSNCPNNWPGALNLLGIGGDPSWTNQPDEGSNFNRPVGGGNNFFAFSPGNNFGSGSAGVAGNYPFNKLGNSNGGGGDPDYSPTDEYEEAYDMPSSARVTTPRRMTPAQSDVQPAVEPANSVAQETITTTTLAENDYYEEDYEQEDYEQETPGVTETTSKLKTATQAGPTNKTTVGTFAVTKAAAPDEESEDGSYDQGEEDAAAE